MKNTKTKILQIGALAIILLGVTQISNAARPATPPQDAIDVLYSGSWGDQSKAGTLLLKSGTNPGTATNGFVLDVEGSLSADGLRTYKTNGTGGSVYVENIISSDSLLPSGQLSNYLCSDTDGVLVRCP